MNHLISYDISDNRLRLKAAKLIKQAGCLRIQYSVFAGTLRESTSQKLAQKLAVLEQNADWSEEDSILILPLHQYSRDQLQIFGTLPPDWDLIQGDLHTLVL
jgi:CRISPR-associated endonuclease Cas2